MYVCVYLSLSLYIYIYISLYRCVCVYIYIYIYICMHINIQKCPNKYMTKTSSRHTTRKHKQARLLSFSCALNSKTQHISGQHAARTRLLRDGLHRLLLLLLQIISLSLYIYIYIYRSLSLYIYKIYTHI